MCSVLTNMASSATESKTEISTTTTESNAESSTAELDANLSEQERENMSDDLEDEEDEYDDDVSVGSPDCDNPDSNPGNNKQNPLRILRKRKNSSEVESNEKPLDFTSNKLSENEHHGSYFLPYKKVSGEASPDLLQQHDKNSMIFENHFNHQNEENSGGKSKRRGVAGFSIDDILSHKTAALKEQQQQQSIVRPWDIAANAAGHNAAASLAAAAASAAALERSRNSAGGNGGSPNGAADLQKASFRGSAKSGNKHNDQGDSPLDALFQMASKTFEGLKAKTGKIDFIL